MSLRNLSPGMLGGIGIVVLSFCTTFLGYWYPQRALLDEHYYISDAQRTLHGVFYLKHNPPLGKMLIAAGEALLKSNVQSDQFLENEVTKVFPPDVSFTGYRFFPALLAWWTAPLFYFALLVLLRNPLLAFFGTFPIVFDTARILHARAAMLDGPMLFFCVAAIACFAVLWSGAFRKGHAWRWHMLLGIALGLAVSVKFVAAPLILLPCALALQAKQTQWHRLLAMLIVTGLLAIGTSLAIWQLHFAMHTSLRPALYDHGTYEISPEFQTLLREHRTWQPWHLPLMLRDALRYARNYNDRIAPLNLCREQELGSPPFLWPLGHRSMRFLWVSGTAGTMYMMLQANPGAWLAGLLGLLGSIMLLAGWLLRGVRLTYVGLHCTFLLIYAAIMASFLTEPRVFFLYHYLLPLTLSLFLFPLCIAEAKRIPERFKLIGMMTLMFLTFVGYQFFLPFINFTPLSNAAFARRNFFPLWELQCADCERESILLTPHGEDNR